jgi:hypothetical protein
VASQQADFLRHIRNIVKNAGTYTGELKFLDGLVAGAERPCLKCHGQGGLYIIDVSFPVTVPCEGKWVACDACTAIPMKIADNWLPTPENVNALPGPVRKYIHDLETKADPAGIVAENTLLRDQTKYLDAMIGRLKAELARSDAQAVRDKLDSITVYGNDTKRNGETLQGQKA